MLRTLLLSLAVVSTTVANAQDAAAQQGGMTSTLIMLAVMGLFFYFMIIRPNKKRQTEHQNLMNELKKGSEVITSAGIIGKVAEVAESYISVEIANNVVIKLQRQAIISMVPKGTYKGTADNTQGNKKAKKEENITETTAEKTEVAETKENNG
ncbi:preprotein translocase subunit YajC [Wohlfahrtiimonas larvae]|uniref:Sec translocon accessory complex subunit YajC n=1 Tax=Wohlfahrtiimonas larvae TaxID=1157986 RepID=A0ABP9MQ01_9GAMM|nr:preprotein translocase subunit YajC [Wohlfahrtiimonas larvae]